jgi:hypothetical protein
MAAKVGANITRPEISRSIPDEDFRKVSMRSYMKG